MMIDCSWKAQREMVAQSDLPDNEKTRELQLIDLQEEYENKDITLCIHEKLAKMLAIYQSAHPDTDFTLVQKNLIKP